MTKEQREFIQAELQEATKTAAAAIQKQLALMFQLGICTFTGQREQYLALKKEKAQE
jgi:hypothetical protein